MTIYSDFPGRRVGQVLGDLVSIVIIALGVTVGVIVHDAIAVFAAVGKSLEDAGNGFSGPMSDAGETLGKIPILGDGIRAPFDAASEAGTSLADAGVAQQQAVETLATTMGVVVALAPILLVLAVWALTRLRFVLRATELRAIGRMAEGSELLALRALTTARASELRKIPGSSVAGWRDRNPEVLSALASIELREGGLRRQSQKRLAS